MSPGAKMDMVEAPSLFAVEYRESEKRDQDEAARKSRVKSVGELQRRRASMEIINEHARMTAVSDAHYVATLYRELTGTHRLPEELARAIVLKESRMVVGRTSTASSRAEGHEEDEVTYAPLPGPVGNEHG